MLTHTEKAEETLNVRAPNGPLSITSFAGSVQPKELNTPRWQRPSIPYLHPRKVMTANAGDASQDVLDIPKKQILSGLLKITMKRNARKGLKNG